MGTPPDAKLPRTHELLICRHRLGYLTATTEWFVTGLTRELDGSMSPHAWESLTPAVWQLSSAWISLVIGSKVSTCCRIQANRINDREKLTVCPSRRSGSISLGSWAASTYVADLNWPTRPGSIVLMVSRSSDAVEGSWLVHTLPVRDHLETGFLWSAPALHWQYPLITLPWPPPDWMA